METAGQPVRHVSKALIIAVIIVGCISTFASGFFLAQLLSGEQTAPQTTPAPQPDSDTKPTGAATNNDDPLAYLAGKPYLFDEVWILTKDTPRIAIQANAARTQVGPNNSYIQNTRIAYFNGAAWARKSETKSGGPDSKIMQDSLIKKWAITIDVSRVLKQSVEGEFMLDNKRYAFTTGELQNEISIRSLQDYTRFLSNGDGTLTVDGVTHKAHILYTRMYSPDASGIQFYIQPIDLVTDLVGFWDEEGNFYHLDSTQVKNPTPIYASHMIAVFDQPSGIVAKTFQATITRDSVDVPTNFTVKFGSPINDTLTFKRLNSLDKLGESRNWIVGLIEGTVTKADGKTLQGIGHLEYVRMTQ